MSCNRDGRRRACQQRKVIVRDGVLIIADATGAVKLLFVTDEVFQKLEVQVVYVLGYLTYFCVPPRSHLFPPQRRKLAVSKLTPPHFFPSHLLNVHIFLSSRFCSEI